MVAFFDAIDAIVAVAVETQVDPFLAQIEAVTGNSPTLGGYTITQYTSIVSTDTRFFYLLLILISNHRSSSTTPC